PFWFGAFHRRAGRASAQAWLLSRRRAVAPPACSDLPAKGRHNCGWRSGWGGRVRSGLALHRHPAAGAMGSLGSQALKHSRRRSAWRGALLAAWAVLAAAALLAAAAMHAASPQLRPAVAAALALLGLLAAVVVRGGRRSGAWQGPAPHSAPGLAADADAAEGEDSDNPPWDGAAGVPGCIYHAMHDTFEVLQARLPGLVAQGFDAVQLPPAQRCTPGDLREEWWLRYQPRSYGAIDPALGGESGLRQLCAEAAALGVAVIADCVFNHCAVVASREEWEAAQHDEGLLEELKGRLDTAFGPELCRDDFQFPWVALEGDKWDDPRFTYEGWGCGEWSELRWSPKVLALHFQHLRLLLTCGVRGFRFDAAKHMRPAHVCEYVSFLRKEGAAFVYAEVLSMNKDVHNQYTELSCRGFPVLSTDFIAASQLHAALRGNGSGGGCCALPRLAGVDRLGLGGRAVRFVRNHDTVLNAGEALCGIAWRSAEDAGAAWAYVLAHSGSPVLIYGPDAEAPAVRRALAFRAAVARAAATAECGGRHVKPKGGACPALETEAVLWPPPEFSLVLVVMRSRGERGRILGVAAFNFSHCGVALGLPEGLHGRLLTEVRGGDGLQQPSISGPCSRGSELGGREEVAPNTARLFLVDQACAQAVEDPNVPLVPARFTLLYFSGWSAPHIHFRICGHWSSLPGWPLARSAPPPGRGPGECSSKSKFGCWWRIAIPLPCRECCVEFVLNDGAPGGGPQSWDNPVIGGNYYIPKPGTYALERGSVCPLSRGSH
ncbi:unnamed protein product, partial [Prorocentrum cordatum]